MAGLACALDAFRRAIFELQAHYAAVHSGAAAAPVGGTSGRDAALRLPYPLRDAAVFRDVKLLQPGRLLYTATHVPTQRHVCVKFSASDIADGVAVQRAWAADNLAPEVIGSALQQLPGGFFMVIMECLSTDQEWQSLFELPVAEREAALQCAQQALARAHALPVSFGTGSQCVAVHGDCRSANVMVRLRDGRGGSRYDVRFIDFDWAGAAGVQRYPLYMSAREVVPWAAGAKPGGVMQQAHDIELLPTETRALAARSQLHLRRPAAASLPPNASSGTRAGASRLPPHSSPSHSWARHARRLFARASPGIAPLPRTAAMRVRAVPPPAAVRMRALAPPLRLGGFGV